MTVLFADRVASSLASGITSGATSITLETGQGADWPTIAAGEVVFAVIVDGDVWEEINVTAVSTDTLTVTRNQGGTNQAWSTGARIFAGLPARWLEKISEERFTVAASDESTAITTGTGKVTFRMPFAMRLTEVRASLNVASTSGAVTIDVNEGGSTIFSTALTIDQDEKTSTTAATAAVISDPDLADDAEITIDVDGAGASATGLKITFIGQRAV